MLERTPCFYRSFTRSYFLSRQMGQKESLPAKKQAALINGTSQIKTVMPFPRLGADNGKRKGNEKLSPGSSQLVFRKHVKKLLKALIKTVIPCHKKSKRYYNANTNSTTVMSILSPSPLFDGFGDADRNRRAVVGIPGSAKLSSSEHQLHWVRSKHSSLLSYALSKLAFFARRSKEKLGATETTTKEVVRRISLSEMANNKALRLNLLQKLLTKHSSMQMVKFEKLAADQVLPLKKCPSPEEIYNRNLKKFETLVLLTASTSSSATSQVSTKVSKTTASSYPTNMSPSDVYNNNLNLASGGSGSLDENCNPPLKRLISTSKNQVVVDYNFLEWVKKKMNFSATATAETETTVGKVQVSTQGSSSLSTSNSLPKITSHTKSHTKTNATNTRTPTTITSTTTATSRPSKFTFLKKGSHHQRSNASGRSTRGTTRHKTGTSTTRTTESERLNGRRCEKCGPCAGKGALAGAPPVYLDYGEGGAANSPGGAWKTKRKGDPIMDRLKNVDVVEQMTYMVPNEGQGDCCKEEVTGDEEDDDCEYYAVCESCGEMEPVPEALQKELRSNRRKRKTKVDNTPVTYSRRQRFNFKSKGEMDEDGPPYSYDGLHCPGQGCRCSCCVAGLRRDPDCDCKCCQSMGPARKCNSFDEIPVGKNPQIRRILCPEEECARIRETCHKMMPDNSGLYNYDIDTQMFEVQVPRTPTPIVVEVEVPTPLTKQQLLALGREVQEKKRRGIGVDAYCPPQEQQAMYLPPIYGQCNPPCVPNCCQPCCQPCCGETAANADEKNEATSTYTYGSYSSFTTKSRTPHSTSKTGMTAPTASKMSKGTKAISTSNDNEKLPSTDDAQSKQNKVAKKVLTKKTSSSESLPTF